MMSYNCLPSNNMLSQNPEQIISATFVNLCDYLGLFAGMIIKMMVSKEVGFLVRTMILIYLPNCFQQSYHKF